jgi:hypothetical protein
MISHGVPFYRICIRGNIAAIDWEGCLGTTPSRIIAQGNVRMAHSIRPTVRSPPVLAFQLPQTLRNDVLLSSHLILMVSEFPVRRPLLNGARSSSLYNGICCVIEIGADERQLTGNSNCFMPHPHFFYVYIGFPRLGPSFDST